MGHADQGGKDHDAVPECIVDELVIIDGEAFQELDPLGSLAKDELHDQSGRVLRRRLFPRSAQRIRVVVDARIAHGVDEQVLHALEVVTHNSNVIYDERWHIRAKSLLPSCRNAAGCASSPHPKACCGLSGKGGTEFDLLEGWPLPFDEAVPAVVANSIVVQVDHLQRLPIFLAQPIQPYSRNLVVADVKFLQAGPILIRDGKSTLVTDMAIAQVELLQARPLHAVH